MACSATAPSFLFGADVILYAVLAVELEGIPRAIALNMGMDYKLAEFKEAMLDDPLLNKWSCVSIADLGLLAQLGASECCLQGMYLPSMQSTSAESR